MEDQDRNRCAHERCSCVFEADAGFPFEGETYCSSGCAMGQGCDHGECECSSPDAALSTN